MSTVPILLERGVEQVVDVKVKLPERAEKNVLARVHHGGSGGRGNVPVHTVMPALDGGGKHNEFTEGVNIGEVCAKRLHSHVQELLIIEPVDRRRDTG